MTTSYDTSLIRVSSIMKHSASSLGECIFSKRLLVLTRNDCVSGNVLQMRWRTMQLTAGMLRLNAPMVGSSVSVLLIDLHMIFVHTQWVSVLRIIIELQAYHYCIRFTFHLFVEELTDSYLFYFTWTLISGKNRCFSCSTWKICYPKRNGGISNSPYKKVTCS